MEGPVIQHLKSTKALTQGDALRQAQDRQIGPCQAEPSLDKARDPEQTTERRRAGLRRVTLQTGEELYPGIYVSKYPGFTDHGSRFTVPCSRITNHGFFLFGLCRFTSRTIFANLFPARFSSIRAFWLFLTSRLSNSALSFI